MRYCNKCKEEKNKSEFYRHTRDGFQAHCKSCKRVESRLRNRQPGRKLYNKKKHQEWAIKYAKIYYQNPEVKKRRAEQMKLYRKNPQLRFKMNARWILHRALKAGKLFKEACITCGNQKSQAHHPDYNKPLLVVWLCRKCHQLEHLKAEGRV